MRPVVGMLKDMLSVRDVIRDCTTQMFVMFITLTTTKLSSHVGMSVVVANIRIRNGRREIADNGTAKRKERTSAG